VFDGHSVLLVGYRDDAAQPGGGLLLIRNSGEAGPDGALPYAYASQYMNDAAVIDLEAG
jgi:C1A family cysteine protease